MSNTEIDMKGLEGLVEKIIKELNQVLENHELTEFDIVAVESTTNKSPVLYVQSSLGLESWCVKHVYNYCYTELIRDFLTNPKRRLSRVSNLNCKRIVNLLNPTILINPDVTSLWNKRREIMVLQFHDWYSEMHFSKLVLTRKPKCNEAFAYRRWILKNLLDKHTVDGRFFTSLIAEELKICTMAADKCRNNYHCWEHRAFILDLCWHFRYNYNHTVLFFNEYRFIQKWTSSHVSDYSCFHHRQVCIKKLLLIQEMFPAFDRHMRVDLRCRFQNFVANNLPADCIVAPDVISDHTIGNDELITRVLGYCPGNCKCYGTAHATLRKLNLLFYELELNEDLLKYYKNHQTIWYHRRFLANSILEAMYTYLGVENKLDGSLQFVKKPQIEIDPKNKCNKCNIADLTEHHNNVKKQKEDWFWECPLFKAFVSHERELIKERRKEDATSADDYAHYLKLFEGLFYHFYPSVIVCTTHYQMQATLDTIPQNSEFLSHTSQAKPM